MLFLTITIVLLIPYVFLILYYRNTWVSHPTFVPNEGDNKERFPFISVIVPARNEEQNMAHLITSIMNGSYPQERFELIIVNDHSEDRTEQIITSFDFSNLTLLNLSDFTEGEKLNSYKKKAIDIALRLAKGELIVTTDADCRVPHQWLELIASFYEKNEPVFIAAPVVFETDLMKRKSTKAYLLGIFQELDFMTLQGITGAGIFSNFHYMCNGANLAYTQKAFEAVEGFKGIDSIASGDDMLLMHKIEKAFPRKVLFLKSQEAIVQTAPEDTLGGFINQRIRWAGKSDQYTDRKIMGVMVLVYLLNVWMLTLGIVSIFSRQALMMFVGAICIKICVELLFLYPIGGFFRKRKLLWWFVLAQPFHILYTVIVGGLGKFGTYEWKGRKVK